MSAGQETEDNASTSADGTAAAQPEETSPLLRLPGELKNRIYALVLSKQKIIVVKARGHYRPPLLNMCKRIRRDTLKMFYGETTLRCNSPDWNMDPHVQLVAVCQRPYERHQNQQS
ncbi:hypothetical protein Slin15195_G115900 [Septoria linicola]|uniref:Uncharacterized protein n=1 Tax=Septoria linicola TaxID=215465 RepID=A0A9Q9B8E8_9PEZI|nr:hypothetical protein Slin15195_G115900 [Septoria linicola]